MRPIVKWQYSKLEDTLGLLEEHLSDPDCPCSSEGEACARKHLKRAEAYAAETIAILTRSDGHGDEVEKLAELAEEAKEFRLVEEKKLCGGEVGEDESVSIGWAGTWRKYFENLVVGSCDLPPPTPALVEEVARMFRKKAEPRWCHPVRETGTELGKLSKTLGTAKKRIAEIQKHLEMPLNICRGQAEMFESTTGVLDPYGSRCRDPETGQWMYSEECGFEPAGITTTALGMDGLTRYEFEFKLVSLDKLIVSHDPFTFTPNPNYPKELQPRLRERAATKIQVEKIAANLEPDAVITDFHVIDRGTPIVGPDLVVEAGNGRVMGIIKAAADHPDKYADYKDRLRERASDYGLSDKDVDSIENPVLIRVRITDVDRTTFTQEANQAATIAPSAIENARTDAQKITMGMLQELIVGENESLEDALRSPKNQAFAKRFLATLPETVQAALVDAQGYLNRDGVHRMAMAVFVSAFQGDPGLRLAEKAFESVDMDVRNTVNAIARSLGTMAQAEALTRTGERDTALSIGDDLAQTVNVYSAIKRNPALTVEKYLAQEQIFARELTPFQEKILIVLEEYRRSPRKLASIFIAYAEGVISAPPPAQAALIPGAEITKEGLWESAVKAPEVQPALIMEVIRMFEETISQEMCERPSGKHQYLSTFFTETAAEAVLFATETGVIERKIDTVLAQLESGISEIQESAKFKAFIDTMSKFHNYSLGNIILITLQNPGATRVAGYRTWLELDRNVRKGEHGIMILAPCFPPKPKKEEEEEDEEEIEPELRPVYFKVVHVFDIGQTEGKELPRVEVPVIKGEETAALFKDAATYVAKQSITLSSIPKPELSPDLMGFWSEPEKLIWVRPDVPQDQRTKTLLHEIAHAMCAMRGARDAEVMAESVAYTVANHFGYDTGVRSFPYVAVWAGDVKVLKSNLEIIRKVARDMIQGIEQVAELSVVTMEVSRMFEKTGNDKHGFIRRILDMEIWLGQLDLGKTRDRVKSLAKLKVDELDSLYRDLIKVKLDWDRLVEQSIYTGLGKTVPAYLQEEATLQQLSPARHGAGCAMITLAKEALAKGQIAKAMANLEVAEEWIKCPEVIKAGLFDIARMFTSMKLLTQEIREKLPPLYSQQNISDPMVRVKFFTPDSNWTWYGIEFDGDDTFFGWVVGFEKELGYFSLKELGSARGPMGLAIERDKWFTPMPLSKVKKLHQGEMAQGTMAAIGSAAITGIGIGAGFKFIDWVASKFGKKELKEGELVNDKSSAGSPYARQLPAYVDVFRTTIAKHYRPTEDFHEGSIRVVKPESDVLVYLGCLKGDDWDAEAERCSPNPTVVKTIVPNTKKYLDELEHLKLVHPEVKINYQTEEVGVEPVVSEEEQKELEAVDQALEHAEEVA